MLPAVGKGSASEIRHPRLPAKLRLHLRPQPGGREPSNGGLRRSVEIDGEKFLFSRPDDASTARKLSEQGL